MVFHGDHRATGVKGILVGSTGFLSYGTRLLTNGSRQEGSQPTKDDVGTRLYWRGGKETGEGGYPSSSSSGDALYSRDPFTDGLKKLR